MLNEKSSPDTDTDELIHDAIVESLDDAAKAKPDDAQFKLGQEVTWRSQAGGIWATKTGKIIEVVPEGHAPTKLTSTSSRKHTSYIVEVPRKAKNPNRPVKPELYWPVVSGLKLAKKVKSDKTKLSKSKSTVAVTPFVCPAPLHLDDAPATRDLGSDGGQGDPPDYEAALRRGLANGLGITDVNNE